MLQLLASKELHTLSDQSFSPGYPLSLFNELKRRNVLRVGFAYLACSWLLIQIVETLLPIFGLPETSARIVVVVLAIGFIPAVVVSWLFELTPEGLIRDGRTDVATSGDPQSTKTIDRIIMISMVLAIAYFSIDKFILDPARDATQINAATQKGRDEALRNSYADKSIAVLPFVDLSANGDQRYFSDGIAEELLNVLAKIRELRVISRSSSFSFRDDQVDIPTIAKKLSVNYILEGSVRKFGNRIRITAQLIDARTDSHLWSENYDRELDDVFAIQDEIAAEVVAQLKLTLLGPRPVIFRTNPETYALYLQAKHIWNQRISKSYDRAEELLDRALELDPQFVPAWTTIALIYLGQLQTGDREVAATRRLIRNVVATASSIAPDYLGVVAWKAWFAYAWDEDIAAAARLYEQALAIDPGDPATLRVVLNFLVSLGRPDEAIEVGEFAIARDPLCLSCYRNLLDVYLLTDRPHDAIVALDRMRALDLSSEFTVRLAGDTYILLNQPQAALEEYLKLHENRNALRSRAHGSAIAYYRLGQFDNARTAMEELAAFKVSRIHMAEIYAQTERIDLAFEILYQQEPGCCSYRSYFLNILHNDPRWPVFLKEFARPRDENTARTFKFTLPNTASK